MPSFFSISYPLNLDISQNVIWSNLGLQKIQPIDSIAFSFSNRNSLSDHHSPHQQHSLFFTLEIDGLLVIADRQPT